MLHNATQVFVRCIQTFEWVAVIGCMGTYATSLIWLKNTHLRLRKSKHVFSLETQLLCSAQEANTWDITEYCMAALNIT